MGVQKYLIDSNTVIDYLNGKLPFNGNSFVNSIVDEEPKISVITKIEVLGFNLQSGEDYQIVVDFINDNMVYNLDESIINKTIELRKKYKIKLPDAIIAATALCNDLAIVSRNTDDFKKIKELKIINPFEL
ncbi:MAG: type II toxin-antitoxin system VapC family toxin [Bacteroidota bacterium]|jgi:predicted nucleic acid-binding protein